jgi:hypothetical protein
MHKYPRRLVLGRAEIAPNAGGARPAYLTDYTRKAYLLKSVLRRKE